jgi:hypothetical protein
MLIHIHIHIHILHCSTHYSSQHTVHGTTSISSCFDSAAANIFSFLQLYFSSTVKNMKISGISLAFIAAAAAPSASYASASLCGGYDNDNRRDTPHPHRLLPGNGNAPELPSVVQDNAPDLPPAAQDKMPMRMEKLKEVLLPVLVALVMVMAAGSSTNSIAVLIASLDAAIHSLLLVPFSCKV